MARIVLAMTALFCFVLASVASASNHAEYVGKGPFKTGPDVTKKCLECHMKVARAFMRTTHWTLSKEQVVNSKKVVLGKNNAINNFCIALPGNESRCTSCHAGYGWKDGKFDFSKAENIDCLVCHDSTGTYKKFPSGAGHPVYPGEKKEFPKGVVWKPVDLVKVAQNVQPSSRENCGACHFYGGGGDRVKHGDLDSAMVKPSRDLDVHMGGKSDMKCQSCHKSTDHKMKGELASTTCGFAAPRQLSCTDCHSETVHKNTSLNKHAEKVACQTCHIPTFAKVLPTKTWWDWSKAGENRKEIAKDKYGEKTYDKAKGEFKWEKDVVPEYYWYNGSIERYIAGDKIDPRGGVVKLNSPRGDRKDPNAKIFPFKIMRGKQPYDVGNSTIAYAQLFGPPGSDAYWQKFNWELAISAGMRAAGQAYSGKYGFVETSMVWPVNHMVTPKDKALKCSDCHGEKGRLNWKALGYDANPYPLK